MLENRTSFRRLFTLAIALCALVVVPAANAQITTGSIAGQVSASGDALPGVTVEAIHTPTGTRYDAVSGSNGRYTIPNVRVGGPYRITATLEGFRPFEATNVNVSLGSTAEVGVSMQLSTVSESITVTATADDIINPNRTGAASAVSEEQIESLPTVNRTLQDFARTNPYFNVDPQDASATRMTVAGKSNRYNNIQIDGAVNNDLFGLSATGAPAGQTESQPISLDAIEELQLLVAPYDVRQGGFSGGGLNAVTKSGTNALHGTAYYLGRSETFVGRYTDPNSGTESLPYGAFSEKLGGGSVGGPLRRNRAFFFGNFEVNRRGVPSGFSVGGSSGVDFGRVAEATRVVNVLDRKSVV